MAYTNDNFTYIQLPCKVEESGYFSYWCISMVRNKTRLPYSFPILLHKDNGHPVIYWFELNHFTDKGLNLHFEDYGRVVLVPLKEEVSVNHNLFFRDNWEKNFFYSKEEADGIVDYLIQRFPVPEYNGTEESKQLILEKYNNHVFGYVGEAEWKILEKKLN